MPPALHVEVWSTRVLEVGETWRVACTIAPVMNIGPDHVGDRVHLDFTRRFLPDALSAFPDLRRLDDDDRLRLNQIRAASYLHLFSLFESQVASVARKRVPDDAERILTPLVRLDAFDHASLFEPFLGAFKRGFPVPLRTIPDSRELTSALTHAVPHALLVLALHLKLVTQQHYLACVRGDEALDPSFVKVLKAHWNVECGTARSGHAGQAIQSVLVTTAPGRIPAALRDYRLLVFAFDDVLSVQAALDVETLEEARGAPLARGVREATLKAELGALRKTFLTIGIVNAAFVYAMRSLGPQAPYSLAGVVAALGARG